MGRLRSECDLAYLRKISAETVDLFGVDDAILYKIDADARCRTKDALYSEPSDGLAFVAYKIKANFTEIADTHEASELGETDVFTNVAFVSWNLLEQAGVPLDDIGDHISEGDLIELFYKGARLIYDIKQVDRAGYHNNTQYWTGYNLTLDRNSKYYPDRKILPPITNPG